MNDKLLSIIVPSYNMEQYLPKCLGSLLVDDRELLEKLDVIVVNDGSKDRTSEIAHRFEADYPGVFRVIDKPNGNYGSCINAALPVAIGLYVRVLDADDSVDTKEFEAFLSFVGRFIHRSDIKEMPDLLLSDYNTVDLDGIITATHQYAVGLPSFFRAGELQDGDRIATHAVAYRKAMLLKMDYHQTEGVSYTDSDWTYYPMSEVHSILHFSRPVVQYLRGRVGQTMEKTTHLRGFITIINLYEKNLDFYKLHCIEWPSDIRKNMLLQLAARIQAVYWLILVDRPDCFSDETRARFHAHVCISSEDLVDAVMKARLSTHFSFCPVKEWDRYHRIDTMAFRVFRFYRRLVAWKKCLSSKFKGLR